MVYVYVYVYVYGMVYGMVYGIWYMVYGICIWYMVYVVAGGRRWQAGVGCRYEEVGGGR